MEGEQTFLSSGSDVSCFINWFTQPNKNQPCTLSYGPIDEWQATCDVPYLGQGSNYNKVQQVKFNGQGLPFLYLKWKLNITMFWIIPLRRTIVIQNAALFSQSHLSLSSEA